MRPLPCSSPAFTALDRLLRLLPRRCHEGLLHPMQQLEPEPAEPHAWRATGEDPAFHLTGALTPVNAAGWYFIEGYLRKTSSTATKLYADFGAGYDEAHAWLIPVTRRGYIREVVRLPGSVRALRLDPTEAEGGFVLEWINVQGIGSLEAWLRRLGRVLFDHHRFSQRVQTREAARSQLLAPLLRGDLATAYAQSAQMRIPARGNESATEIWRNHQRRQQAMLSTWRDQAAALRSPTLVSVLVPTYNTAPDMLHALVQSVQAQVYPHWELLLWDDASTAACTRELAAGHAARDGRIRCGANPANAGVAATTNAALAAARGEFVVLLDHDDLLEPQALLRVVQCGSSEQADFLYSDEVIVDASGDEVLDFALRPAFSLEYYRHHPYIVHMLAFRRSFLLRIGGLDASLRISQDVDLVLRAAEAASCITHIPEVLYRWRTLPESAGHQKRSEVSRATAQIVQRHLARCGEAGVVEPEPQHFNHYRPQYATAAHRRVAVVIPTKNHHALLMQCVQSLERTTAGLDVQIVVVDHASDDPATLAYLDSIRGRHTVLAHAGPFNFSQINNRAVRQLDGSHTHLLFCNNDIEALEAGWLDTMLGLAERPGVGIVGAHLLYGDRAGIQHAGVGIGMFGAAEHFGKFMPHVAPHSSVRNVGYRGTLLAAREVSAVTAACVLVRRACFEDIGGFDEALAVGFGDTDLCLRARGKGWRVIQSGGSVLVHHESKTRGTSTVDPHPEDSALFTQRWQALIQQGDPFFHPLLSETSTQWAYRQPMPVQATVSARSWRRAEERTDGAGRPTTRPVASAACIPSDNARQNAPSLA